MSSAQDQFNQATTCAGAGDAHGAIEILTRIIHDPNLRHNALGHRAWYYRGLGDLENARRDYESIALEFPQDQDVPVLLAELDLVEGRRGEAASAALKALTIDEKNRRAAKLLLACQESIGCVDFEREALPSLPAGASLTGDKVLEILRNDARSYPGSIYPATGDFIYSLVRCLRPRLAIETGSLLGLSSLYIARALEDNGGGALHSFDLFLPAPEYISPVTGARKDTLEISRSHLEAAGLSHRVTFHKGDSSGLIRARLQTLKLPFDFAFIDGDHSTEGCMKDWAAIEPLIAKGGLILLHDTNAEKSDWVGPQVVASFLKLRQSRGCAPGDLQWIELDLPEQFGLTVFQKTAESTRPVSVSLRDVISFWWNQRKLRARGRESH